ncbi:MAG TPA: uracil-DNA glycosylase [Candidatus Paceibacterota bacterium]
MEVKIEQTWKDALEDEFSKEYFEELTKFVKEEYKKGAVYPEPKNIFRAFDLCPFNKVEVVVLGQDPYHGPGQANGLCFAVGENVPLPPSLQNIFKEIESDLEQHQQKAETSHAPQMQGADSGFSETYTEYGGEKPQASATKHVGMREKSRSGDLERWAKQGVLLLNATLTVRAHSAGSHQNKGWEEFTDAVIKTLSDKREGLVFMLWGNYAKAKGAHIDRTRHLVLEAAHPSPFSAHSGFFGCKHFSKANDFLISHHKKPIDWL